LNLYTYSLNNSIKYYDPTGHVVTAWDSANLPDDKITIIAKATEDWEKASKTGDTAGMAAAHATAVEARRPYLYSGQSVGSDGHIITNGSSSNSGSRSRSALMPGTSLSVATVNPKSTNAIMLANNSGAIGITTILTPVRSDYLTGFLSALDDNMIFGASKELQTLARGYQYEDEYEDEYEYYKGRTHGDFVSMLEIEIKEEGTCGIIYLTRMI
jgi:hypothetical protein